MWFLYDSFSGKSNRSHHKDWWSYKIRWYHLYYAMFATCISLPVDSRNQHPCTLITGLVGGRFILGSH